MKIQIVFRDKNNNDIAGGKSFDVQLSVVPRLNEYIMFDYIEKDESLVDIYETLDSIRTSQFEVTEVYHNCAIDELHNVAALIFLRAT